MRLRIGRIIAYALVVAVTVFMFGYFRAFFFLLFFVIELALAAADVALISFLLPRLNLEIETAVNAAKKDDIVSLDFGTENNTFIPSAEIRAYLTTENSFYGTVGHTQVEMPLLGGIENWIEFEMRFSLLGNYSFHVEEYTVRDILGFADIRRRVDTSAGITIFPEENEGIGFDPEQSSAGMTEADESDRRGNDFSEVSEIREYVPGDRPRDIHWKLSAKKDELMVKQRAAMSDQQLVVVVDFADVATDNDRVIEETYSLGKELVRTGVNARLMWWNAAEDDFHSVRLATAEDVDDAFSEMFNGRAIPAHDIDVLMSSVHPEIGSYLRIHFADGKVQETVADGA